MMPKNVSGAGKEITDAPDGFNAALVPPEFISAENARITPCRFPFRYSAPTPTRAGA
ncbi:hypothetical protein I551_7738 [Mycobacterium ulcerans str. Harvey]|uniref:Uncharacterized protein n=1 Tax=Mycobacterium ulcerans str. Harvey TaxID=1299332 RepID=A0ABP3A8K7_MYCUL|nr:hypothetical protein I551_7738 [Mycobacterium ulcerans str. Harvey]